MLKLILMDKENHELARAEGEKSIALTVNRDYEEGDHLLLQSEEPYVYASVDAFLAPAYLYLPEGSFTFRFPVGMWPLLPYSPQAFRSGMHTYTLCEAPEAKKVRRDLALNPLCQRPFEGSYPFVHANVETRDESVFFARNVVDGIHINNSHGYWPYESWGIGLSETAEISVDFGREVTADSMSLTLRADFPHDAYWKQATVTLSDGYTLTFPLEMTEKDQRIPFDRPHVITSARLHSLGKQVMDSPFPALRCWEIFGQG